MDELTPKRRGAPRKAAGGNAAMTWLSDAEYDAVCEVARLNRCSVSEAIRRALRIALIEKSKSAHAA